MSGDISNSEALKPSDAGSESAQHGDQSPPQVPELPSESNPPPSPHCDSKPCKPNRDWLDYVEFAMGIVGLGFLIAYTVYAGLQWCAMRESNRINNAALVATERAYVSVTGLDIRQSTFNPKLVSYIVGPIIVNSGNTPTKNLWWTAVTGTPPITVDQEPTTEDLSAATRNHATLAARQEVRDLIEQPISTAYAEILKKSFAHKHIPVYGAIVYEDGISNPSVVHVRRYCYSLYVNPYFTEPNGLSYAACGGRSNCEDEECDEATQQQMKQIRAGKPN